VYRRSINKRGEAVEYIVSNVIDGSPVHTDYPRLEQNLSVWTKTPEGRKVSFSSGFRVKDDGYRTKYPQFFGRIALGEIIPHAKAVGGTIHRASKSYVQWEVDAEKLTDRLMENNIVAYQISMDKVLFQDARDAEDIIIEAQKQTHEQADFDAVPLNSKGKAVALPVKLRQLLRESSGIDLHKIPPVTPLHNDLTVMAIHPPPG